MIAQDDKVAFMPLKNFLFLIAALFAIAATFLIIWLTSAATGTGSNPSIAISLADGINNGILGPGQQRWFRIVPPHPQNSDGVEKSLSLTFRPANDDLNQYIVLQLFAEEQLQFGNDVSQSILMGTAQLVSTDDNPETSQLFWSGQLFNDNTYYIQLLNNGDFSLNYQLVAEDVPSSIISDTEIEVEIPVQVPAPPPQADPNLGLDPGLALPLSYEANIGHLNSGETHWYTFSGTDFAGGGNFQERTFSLFFSPDDGNRRHNVNFEVFSAQEIETWWQGGKETPINFGAGMIVSRDGDIYSDERIWHGNIIKADTYYVAVQNESDRDIDYWLFDSDTQTSPFNTQTTSSPPIHFAQGVAPQTAIPLAADRNGGKLSPGQEIWYTFSITDFDDEAFEEMALTMIVTPDDGNRIRRVPFDVFTGQGVQQWSPGNPDGINNVGAGSVVYRDNNDLTGERFWSGWIVDNDLYYVRIRNGSDVTIDYWLFNGDVYGPELGETVNSEK